MDELLKTLISDQKKVSDLYKPGRYWWKKSLATIKELEKHGLNEFRSSLGKNAAGNSFTDYVPVDGRALVETSSIQNRLGLAILNHTPLKKLFDFQVHTTRNYLKRLLELEKTHLAFFKPERLYELTKNYKIENSVNFGCDSVTEFKGKTYSTHYLDLLDEIDFVEKNATLKDSYSFLEIGPGFGANIHLIEQNYPNLRKFIAVDIVPNVWVATEYLRNIYGQNVKDYLITREMKEIKFKDDNSLEIFVVPAWQIEKIASPIDRFWNSHSFVEMPHETVSNYGEKFVKLRTSKSVYTFISYDNFDLNTTFHPDQIPDHFPNVKFQKLIHPALRDDASKDYYFYLGRINNNKNS